MWRKAPWCICPKQWKPTLFRLNLRENIVCNRPFAASEPFKATCSWPRWISIHGQCFQRLNASNIKCSCNFPLLYLPIQKNEKKMWCRLRCSHFVAFLEDVIQAYPHSAHYIFVAEMVLVISHAVKAQFWVQMYLRQPSIWLWFVYLVFELLVVPHIWPLQSKSLLLMSNGIHPI